MSIKSQNDDQAMTIQVFGLVQGVFFRSETKSQATNLGLVGWVANQSDGSVLISAQGPEKSLRQLLDWCYNGPVQARVEKVTYHWVKPIHQFSEFEIK